jgi:hypothetical protein
MLNHIPLAANIFCALLAVGCTGYSYKIWRLTSYGGKKWLSFAIGYAAALRIALVVNDEAVGDVSRYAMIVFWVGFFYALHRLYKETRNILYTGEKDK